MPIATQILSSDMPRKLDAPVALPRASDGRQCPVCADTLIAAEGSVLEADGHVSYLWTCETCGYGFVTRHEMKRYACN
jgi:hypothetical protein